MLLQGCIYASIRHPAAKDAVMAGNFLPGGEDAFRSAPVKPLPIVTLALLPERSFLPVLFFHWPKVKSLVCHFHCLFLKLRFLSF